MKLKLSLNRSGTVVIGTGISMPYTKPILETSGNRQITDRWPTRTLKITTQLVILDIIIGQLFT